MSDVLWRCLLATHGAGGGCVCVSWHDTTWCHQGGDADKRTGLMSMAYGDFAAFMADVDKAFSTWDKVPTLSTFSLEYVLVSRVGVLLSDVLALSRPQDRDALIRNTAFRALNDVRDSLPPTPTKPRTAV